MAAITYGTALSGKSTARAISTASAVSGKGFWSRFFDKLVEARMRQAQREIKQHMHLLPDYVEFDGVKFSYKNANELPFVR